VSNGKIAVQTLFRAGERDYVSYRIPGLAVTPQGSILAYCEARRGVSGDWGAIDIWARRSADGGANWEPAHRIAILEHPVPKNPLALAQNLARADERTLNNPVVLPDRDTGTLHLLFCAEYARCFHACSDDDGLTWSNPVDITPTFDAFRAEYDWRVLATGPGHGIQLARGRLLVPVWLSPGTGGHAHRPSCVSVIYSDDHGNTWERGDIVVGDTPETPNPSETVAAELPGGRVMLNIRTESPRNRRLVTVSADGATNWSPPRYDEALFEPICFASMVGLRDAPSGVSYLLFVNPDSSAKTGERSPWGSWPRENLTVRLSADDGVTWPVSRVVDTGPCGYADLAVGPDGTICCLYEDREPEAKGYDLTLVRFDLAWLSVQYLENQSRAGAKY